MSYPSYAAGSRYLQLLGEFRPDLTVLSTLPWSIKLHVFGMFVFLLLLSYSRLVHLLVVPLQFLWRSPQVVIWNHVAARRGLSTVRERAPVEVGR
jgi:nitrate reductase gamma subunit